MPKRRDFLAQLGAAAAALVVDTDELRAAPPKGASDWDTSWIDRLATAKYRVVFNGNEIDDGGVMDYANTFIEHFHAAHGTSNAETRPVIVFRRMGTPMALNDAMWERYTIGEDAKLTDPSTKAPAKRNIYWTSHAGATPQSTATKLESLHARGLISLVCNVAVTNYGRRVAKRVNLDAETVIADLKANLVPGATLVPSGIYALIRAQNAGCAYMPGT